MKLLVPTIAAVSALLAPISAAQGDEIPPAAHSNWIADYDVALAKAKQEKKDLLVDFTGSDWCGWCIKLDEEVFAHDEFLKPAMEKFVLCALDFPNGEEAKAKVPNPTKNQELQARWGIRGFPSILIVTANDETVIARTGYQEGGPEKYVTHLDELFTKGKKALADVAAMQTAFDKSEDKSKVIENAASLLADMDAQTPGVDKMAEIVKSAMDLDAAKHAALRESAIRALLKSGQSDDTIRKTATSMDPKNAKGLLEQAILAQFMEVSDLAGVQAALTAVEPLADLKIHDAETGRMLFSNAARWTAMPQISPDPAKAKKFAKKALDIGVTDPRQKAFLEKLAGDAGTEDGK